MPKKAELYSSYQMKEAEDAAYEVAKSATRKLLIKHKADDLLDMLGLNEETPNDTSNT